METQEPVTTFRVDSPVNEGVLGLDPEVEEELDPIIVALRKERLAQDKTQWDVAKAMGYTAPSYISLLETGKVDLTLSTLRAWTRALGMETLVRAPRSNKGRPRTNFR